MARKYPYSFWGADVSFLFGSKKPQPAPVPVAPTAPDNAEAQRERDAAEAAAVAQRKAAGRQSTIVGGASTALAERQDRLQKSQYLG